LKPVPPRPTWLDGCRPSRLAGWRGEGLAGRRPSLKIIQPEGRVPPYAKSDGNGALDYYQSFAGQPKGWFEMCRTSEATPLFAGIVALAHQVAGHSLGPMAVNDGGCALGLIRMMAGLHRAWHNVADRL
jgi:hypothetical protein